MKDFFFFLLEEMSCVPISEKNLESGYLITAEKSVM